MGNLTFRVRFAMGLLAAICCLNVPQLVRAQVAPTTSASISGSVSDIAGKAVAGAKVSLSGPRNAATQTDAQGLFVFVGVPFGTYQISAAAAGLGTATRTLSVGGDTNVAIQFEPTSIRGLKTIANVSTSANARFNVTPASISQVNPMTNAFEGQTSWRTILEQIPGVAQAGLGNGSSAEAVLPDGPMVPVQISIDGALPYETATLLDNMPLIGLLAETGLAPAGTGTDLGFYPLNSFAAADVVRGPGASASIVDSIGGSLVLHAPGTVNANHYEFSLSTDPYGGIVANGLAAVRWHKLSATVTYGVNDSPGPLSGTGIPAQTAFSPSTIDGRSFQCTGSCAVTYLESPNYTSASFPTYGLQTGLLQCCVNQSTAWNQHSGSVALSYALSPSLNVGVFYAGQISQMGNFGSQNYLVDFAPAAGYSGNLQPGHYSFSTIGVFGGAEPLQTSSSLLEEKITAQLGRGMLQLAAIQNRTFLTLSSYSGAPMTQQLFGGGLLCSNASLDCSSGTYMQTPFDGGTYNLAYSSEISENDTSAGNNRDLLFSYATPIGENVHAGASYVKSYYNNPSQFEETYDGCAFSAVLPSGISQTTNEARIFIGGNPSAKTSIELADYFVNLDYHVPDPDSAIVDSNDSLYTDARYSYSAPRLGFVWRPSPSIAVRAAAGGGFAEAPLGDLVGSNGAPDCNGGGECFVDLVNLNLRPETSFAFDFGTDIRLRQSTVLSFDAYRSNLYGQIYSSSTVTGSCPSCGGLPLYTYQFGNLGVSRFQGIILELRHDVPRGVYWSLSGSLTRGYVVSVPSDFYNTGGTCDKATGANCTNLNVVPNINFNGTFDGAIPYAQASGGFGYRWNAEKYIDLLGTYYGNNNTYYHPAFVELDGHVGYPLTKNVSLLMTFRNITGIYDGAIQSVSPGILSGAPTVSGLPYVLYGEEYGPRTLILTTMIHL